jgi:hypothetical protein
MSKRQPHPTPHSKTELLTSARTKGDTTQGVGHDGNPVAGHFVDNGTEPLTPSHNNHSLGQHIEGHAVKGNLARDGAPKRFTKIPLHGGATEEQHSALRMGGSPQRGEAVPGADPMMPDPLSPAKEKQMAPVKATPGMRSRSGGRRSMPCMSWGSAS